MSGKKLVYLNSCFETQNAPDLRGRELARLESIEGYLLKNLARQVARIAGKNLIGQRNRD